MPIGPLCARHRLNRGAPRNPRRRRVEGSTKKETRVVIHLWSPKSCKWFKAQHVEACANHPSLQAVTSLFVRTIRGTSEQEPSTVEICDYETATQMLTILIVNPEGVPKQTSPAQNMEAYLRHWIGRCGKCYICRNPVALTAMEGSYKVSKEILRVEREVCQPLQLENELQ